MRTVLNIVIKEFLQIRRDKRILGITLVAPIIQLLLMGYAATTDITNVPMAVCDLDHSESSRALVNRFVSSGYFTLECYALSHNEVDDIIDNGRAQIALVIPPQFGDDIKSGKTAPLQVIVDGSDGNTAGIVMGYTAQIASTYSHEIFLQRQQRMASKLQVATLFGVIRVWYNAELKSRNFMIPGVIAMLLLVVTGMLTAQVIVKEREMGTLEQLIVTPIKPWQLVLGKLLPFTAIGMFDVVLVMTVGRFWFDVPMRGSPLLLIGCGGIFLLTSLGLGLFVSTVSRTQQQAMMTMQFFIFIPFIYLSGFTFPVENMPRAIQFLTYIIPLRYFLEIVRGIFLKGNGIDVLWPQMVALFAIGVATLGLSMMRFVKRLE